MIKKLTLTSKEGGEAKPEHSPDISIQRAVQDALLQTHHGLIDKPRNKSVLHIRVWWTVKRIKTKSYIVESRFQSY